jgi:amino acid adenylation domain-containing protein
MTVVSELRLRPVGVGTAAPLSDRALHDLFREEVERDPDRPAVRCGATSLTYAELDAWSERICRALTACPIERGEPVGVLADPGVAFIAGILGVVKAGGAYVPLDPAHGAGRLQAIVEEARLRFVVTDEPPPAREVSIIELSHALPSGPEPIAVDGSDLAYVIYTSGSTGVPKGVAVEHRGVLNLIDDLHQRAPPARGARRSWWASAGFDVSVFEIWPALTTGGEIVVVPGEIRRDPLLVMELLREARVVVAWVPASFLPALRDEARERGDAFSLRSLLVGAEPIPLGTLQDLIAAIPDLVIVNGYGPTETTVCATLYTVPARGGERNRRAPIGEAVSNMRLYIEPADEELPLEGELYVAGVGVARGYLNRPDLTAERFLEEPGQDARERMFRTGDVVRVLPSGDLEYVSRLDHQLKIRGFRIESAEVERALTAEPDVRDAVVVGRELAGGTTLVAYVVGGATIDVRRLRARLAQALPDYMVPSAFVVIDALPLTPNGKVDRNALPVPERTRGDDDSYEPPSSATEKTLAGIWSELLGVEPIGAHDNFFELGGHSALAADVVARARSRFDLDLPLLLLFEAPTLRGLGTLIDAEQHRGPA